MKLYSIDKKQISEGKLTMAVPTFIFMEMAESSVQGVHIVEDDESCRIDLVSLSEYGTHDHVDAILKFNGISNPFSLRYSTISTLPCNERIVSYALLIPSSERSR